MDELYLKLEGIDTREAVSKFIRKDVWIREEEIQATYPEEQSNRMGRIPGYRSGTGTWEPFSKLSNSPIRCLCRLEIESKEVLIPINEQTLDKVIIKTGLYFSHSQTGCWKCYLG